MVASVSYYNSQSNGFSILNLKAISVLDEGAKTKTKIIVDSNGSLKVNVEFIEQSNEVDDYEDEEEPQLTKLPNNIPIQRTV